tara:strand:- start:267 stop:572 length:306 start_codon:yes stop_codon:yes gene_type:complete
MSITKSITLNIEEYLSKEYPSLTSDEKDLIAVDVSRRWDYSWLINSLDHKVRECANYANIELAVKPLTFNTDNLADLSDNEAETIYEEDDNEGLVHESEGC